ncbi:MAG: hypothetical protein M3R15_21265 [Acidobacteriota bacterium]|nr:hypothetical protein [Acidobacteriota bacterium]
MLALERGPVDPRL